MKAELPEEWFIIVTEDSDNFDNTFQILLAKREPRGAKNAIKLPEGNFKKIPGKDSTSSQVVITKYIDDPECENMFILAQASAPRGFGPLLYDIALELAGNAGIIPDRIYVSKDAYKVWEHYLDRREDVETKQLKPEECPPADFYTDDDFDSSAWYNSPLSKVYYKKDKNTIKRLTDSGKLLYRTGDLL